eukprot:m.26927 g.26927  ORF g.26927 m.26927 type:complete len:298 (+) comp29591_c0_seq1:197-1090(+)
MSSPHAISLFRMHEFMESPPPGFSICSRPSGFPNQEAFTVNVDSGQAFFISKDRYVAQNDSKTELHFEGITGYEVTIQTEERLLDVMNAILNLPVYMTCKCKVQTDEHCDYSRRTIYRFFTVADYVVRLETGAEPVRGLLEEAFGQALGHLQANERFSIKIDLSRAIGEWFEVNRAQTYCLGTRTFDDVHFTLTNASLPLYDGMVYSCDDDPAACACGFVMCFPCCLLCCLPYFMCRKCRYTDVKRTVSGEVKMMNLGQSMQPAMSFPGGNMGYYGVPAPVSSRREMEYPLVENEST